MEFDELPTPSELRQREGLLEEVKSSEDGLKINVDDSDELRRLLGDYENELVVNCRSLTVGAMGEHRVRDGVLELSVLTVGKDYENIESFQLETEERKQCEFHGLFESDLPPVATLIPYSESTFAENEED